MPKIESKVIKSERFTVADAAEQLIEIIGANKKLDAAFIVIRAEGKQAVIPIGNALKQFSLLTSGTIERAVEEVKKIIEREFSKHFDQFLDEMGDKKKGGVA